MDLTKLMELFSHADTIHNLTAWEKLVGGLITTVMGMGVTFVALTLLLYAIKGLHRALQPKSTAPQHLPAAPPEPESCALVIEGEEDEEVIAAIMVAIDLTITPGDSPVVIRNIRRIEDFQPRWSEAGLWAQINNRL